jgi:predicted dehydrogenase
VFALTHNYTGHPLVRHARKMILDGELGEIQAIRSNYIQGWLRSRIETGGQKQAAWRTDPAKSGAAGCFGDIGTHAYNLARYMTGLIPAEVSCHLKVFESGRKLDDYGHAVIRFENGALGTVTAIHHGDKRDDDKITVDFDGIGAIDLHRRFFDHHRRRGGRSGVGLDHAYALTSYAVQVSNKPGQLHTAEPVAGVSRPTKRTSYSTGRCLAWSAQNTTGGQSREPVAVLERHQPDDMRDRTRAAGRIIAGKRRSGLKLRSTRLASQLPPPTL